VFYVCICICMKYIMSKYIWYINMNSWGSVKNELRAHRVCFIYMYTCMKLLTEREKRVERIYSAFYVYMYRMCSLNIY